MRGNKFVKIGEASIKLGVSVDTLRRWEKAGKIEVIRTPGGTRLYSTTQLSDLTTAPLKYQRQETQLPITNNQSPITTTLPPYNPTSVEDLLALAGIKTEASSFAESSASVATSAKGAATEDKEAEKIVADYADFREPQPEEVVIFSEAEMTAGHPLIQPTSHPEFISGSQEILKQVQNDTTLPPFHPTALLFKHKIYAFSGAALALFLVFAITLRLANFSIFGLESRIMNQELSRVFNLNSSNNNRQSADSSIIHNSSFAIQPSSDVLAATTANYFLEINSDTAINGSLAVGAEGVFVGNLTAPNIIYSIKGSENVQVTTGQTPTISVTMPANIVNTIQGKSGTVTLVAGTDISISGLTISDNSTLTSVIGRGSCSDCITDPMVVDTLTISSGGHVSGTAVNSDYVKVAYGGTGLTSYTKGDILYATDATTLAKLNIGTANQALIVSSGLPAWGDSSAFSQWTTIGSNIYYNTGNVGIGTSSPGGKLGVLGGVSIGSYSGTAPPPNGLIVSGNVGLGTSAPMGALDVLGGAFFVASNGNVGIGSTATSPAFNLDVNGIVNATALYVNGSPYIGSQWTTVTGMGIYYDSNGNTGNVGIGTSSVANYTKLSVMNGNVGIGTTSAVWKLDVSGDVNIASGSKYKINGTNLAAADIGAEPTIAAGTTAQYYRGDKSWTDINPVIRTALSSDTGIIYNSSTGVIGISTSVPTSVTNDTNVTGSISGNVLTLGWTGTLADGRIASAATWNAKQNALAFASPIIGTGGTVALAAVTGSGTTVVLSDSPTLVGTPLAPTAGLGTSTGQVATTAFVMGQGFVSSSGITSIDGLTGPALTLANSVGSGTTLTINDAAADASTKGIATFVANDFTSSSGSIGLDYANGQVATSGQHGFLSDTDWSTFNNKQDALTFTTGIVGTGTTVTHSTADGYIHIPSGGSSTQLLQYQGTAGTAKWITTSGDVTIADGGALTIGANKVLSSMLQATTGSGTTVVLSDSPTIVSPTFSGTTTIGTLTGLLKGATGVVSAATAGTDYIAGGVGAASQVAYFTSQGVLTGSNTFFFNGTNVGIGTTLPGQLFTVGNDAFKVSSTGVVSAGTWNGTALITTYGGTGLTSYAQGDLVYYNTGTTLTALNKTATANSFLKNSGTSNNPAWSTIASTDLSDTANLAYLNTANIFTQNQNFTLGFDVDDAFVIADGGALTTSQAATFNGNLLFGTSTGILASGGNLGIGTTSPLGILHVAGQCVTGDTKLKRRKKKKNGEWSDDYEDINIKDIKEGDQILSLNEKIGEFEPHTVKNLKDMGKQEVWKLITQSGKIIETTNEHPYLTLEKTHLKGDKKLTVFEVDQSIRVEDKNADTILAIANIESSFIMKLDKKQKQIISKDYAKRNQPRLLGPEIFAKIIIATINKFDLKVTRLIIDREYSENYDALIVKTIEEQIPHIIINFKSIGHQSPAHKAAYAVKFEQKRRGPGQFETQRLLGFRTSSHPAEPGRFESPLSLLTNPNYTTKWEKVKFLEPGMIIATVDGWEKIQAKYSTGRKQTFDIEVEGTHNFVGNNIVAHNTALFTGNVGIGTTVPLGKLSIVDGNQGLNKVWTSDASGNGTWTSIAGAGGITGTGTSGYMPVWTGTSTQANSSIWNSNGNIGIGTTSPSQKLDVVGVAKVSNWIGAGLNAAASASQVFNGRADRASDTQISIENQLNDAAASASLNIGTLGASTVFQVNRSGNLSITGQGNMGIGTTSPLATLDVNGALKATTFNGNTITTGTGTLTLGAGKTLTASDTTTLATNSITFAGTEALTLAATKNVTFADAFATSGAYALTLTTTNTTNVTLPTTGTLATLAGAESFSNKTFTGNTIFPGPGIWDTNGNVGIGTTSPGHPLTINGNNASTIIAYTGAQPAAFSTAYGTTIGAFDDGSGAQDYASVLAGQNLSNFGGMRWNYNATAANASIDIGSFSTQRVNLVVGALPKLTIDTGGNVGIGTTAPGVDLAFGSGQKTIGIQTADGSDTGRLVLVGSSAPTSGRGAYLALAGTDHATIPGEVTIGSGDAGAIKLLTGISGTSYERLRITNDGNVGIGTTSPTHLFQVGNIAGNYFTLDTSGTAAFSNYYAAETNPRYSLDSSLLGSGMPGLGFRGSSDGTIVSTGAAIGSPAQTILGLYTTNGAALVERMRIDSAGNVGIGVTNPTGALQVGADATWFSKTSATNNLIQQYGYGTDPRISMSIYAQSSFGAAYSGTAGEPGIKLSYGAASSYIIGGANLLLNPVAGNVGIGTTSPTSLLHVNGSATVINNLGVGGAPAGNYGVFVAGNNVSSASGLGAAYAVGTSGILANANSDTLAGFYVNGSSFNTNGKTGLILADFYAGTIAGRADSTQAGLYVAAQNNAGTTNYGVYIGAISGSTNNYGLYTTSGTTVLNATSGNVGIGTAVPQGKLDIFSSTNTTTTPLLSIRSDFAAAGRYGMIRFGDQSQTTDYQKGGIIYNSLAGSARGSFMFALENTDGAGSVSIADTKMTILSNGNVGIGTTVPDHNFQIGNGSAVTQMSLRGPGSNTASSYINFEDVNGGFTNYWFRIFNDTSNNLLSIGSADVARIMNFARTSGNVGIGTTSPGALLSLSKSLAATTFSSGVALRIDGYQAASKLAGIGFNYVGSASTDIPPVWIGVQSQDYTNFTTADFIIATRPTDGPAQNVEPTERFRITKGGNVGIGTTVPTSKLHIAGGDAEFDGRILADDGSQDSILMRGTSEFGLEWNDTSSGQRWDIWNGTNGTYGANFADYLVFHDRTNGQVKMTFAPGGGIAIGYGTLPVNPGLNNTVFGGNVGIGTTSPTSPLFVSGSVAGAAGTTPVLIVQNTYPTSSSGQAEILLDPAMTGASWNISANDNSDLFRIFQGTDGANPRFAIDGSGNIGIGTISPTFKLDVGSPIGGSVSAGAAGLIRNMTSADTTPYTQSRIVVYGGPGVDTGNWAYFGYGADAALRVAYGKTGAGAPLYFGTTSAMDGTGTFTTKMSLSMGGDLTVYGSGTTCSIGNGTGATNCTSDARLKTNVVSLDGESSLDKIMQLNPIAFKWIDPTKDQTTNMGLIAQEVQSIFPQAVHEVSDTGYLGIDYAALIVPVIKAIQEQQLILNEMIAKTSNITVSPDGSLYIPNLKVDKLVLNGEDLAFSVERLASSSSENSLKLSLLESTVSAQVAGVSTKISELESRLQSLESNYSSSESASREASSSSTFSTLSNNNSTDSGVVASTPPQNDINSLNLTPPDVLLATNSASLNYTLDAINYTLPNATISGQLQAYSATISDTFKALGDSFLGNTTVAGNFSVDGTMSLSGNSINSIYSSSDNEKFSPDGSNNNLGILYLQNSPLAGKVDLFNGLVVIDNLGKIVAQEITTNKLTIKEQTQDSTIGSGKLLAGQTKVAIFTNKVSSTSKVFITPKSSTKGQTPFVELAEPGTGFVVSIDSAVTKDIDFDWWIVETQ